MNWEKRLFNGSFSFEQLALEAFQYQATQNSVYAAYLHALHCKPEEVNSIQQIPFLPIGFFKSHAVKSGTYSPALVFESSSTTGTTPSQHLVRNPSLYQSSFLHGFEQFWGSPQNTCIIGLLPSYLERKNSSLVYMVKELIERSGHPNSGFYLNEMELLSKTLTQLELKQQRTLLIGVTFALLHFASTHPQPLQHTTLIETGGMKGRAEELTREEVHARLKNAFHLSAVASEYGMTELFSQAWSTANGIFNCPPWMRVLVREEEDPLSVKNFGNGGLNIIDLANIDSCCFIATDDVGRVHPNGHFEMLGRLDGASIRGCSLLTA
ncbi:MAG: acyl transferase [Bacteroidetes bacterium]|nr:acyl transferase [Bacteroidota bacterium]